MSLLYDKKNPSSIQKMFCTIAPYYDRGNAALSMQLFRLWNRRLIQEVILPHRPEHLLDLCCGTGEISFAYLRRLQEKDYAPNLQVTLLDFSEGMLHEAKKKETVQDKKRARLNYVAGDAQAIPLQNCSVDVTVIAYGIRNVANPLRCLEESYRALKPGGRLGILELTRPSHPLMRWGHSLYLQTLVPLIGRLVTTHQEAYHYLSTSVETFIAREELEALLQTAGFQQIKVRPLMGGIATLFTGLKQ